MFSYFIVYYMIAKSYTIEKYHDTFLKTLARARKQKNDSVALRFILDTVMVRKNIEILNQDISKELASALSNIKKTK